MSYQCIHTHKGLQLLAQAEAQGTQLRLTHIAVGDGQGYAVSPDPAQNQLVRESFRTTINRVFQDPENANKFTVEMIIPVSAGGFVMREVGVFDSNGNLILVGNLPDTYKPVANDGAFNDTVIRIPFMVSNASTIQLQVDPNVVIATHSWILNTITAGFLLGGGTTGQVLKKQSNIDGDVVWEDPSASNVFVDTLEEEQQLAEQQTQITLSQLTTTGLAVYINGQRISQKAGAEGWQALSATKIQLGQSYAAGSHILCVQNEPLGTAPYPLAKAENLADVEDKALARQNLDVFSKAESRSNGLPAGSMIYVAMNKAPTGYLKANGAAISRTVYAELFAEIGTSFGAGDGVNTFNLPDCRGEFIRGWDDGRGIDLDRVLGSKQSGSMKSHYHGTGDFGSDAEDNWYAIVRNWEGKYTGRWVPGESNRNLNTSITGGTGGMRYTGTSNQLEAADGETRPRNLAFLACIKY
ncbi:phage tail-collar fiber domain-containing protein [Acinetobacter sp. ANC 4636]